MDKWVRGRDERCYGYDAGFASVITCCASERVCWVVPSTHLRISQPAGPHPAPPAGDGGFIGIRVGIGE
jgi:hypothetical protein